MDSNPTNQDTRATRHDSIAARTSTSSQKPPSWPSISSTGANTLNTRYYEDNPVPNSATPSRPPSVAEQDRKKSKPVKSAFKKAVVICWSPFAACCGIPFMLGYLCYRDVVYDDMGEWYMNGRGEKERKKAEKKKKKEGKKREEQRMKAEKKEEKQKRND